MTDVMDTAKKYYEEVLKPQRDDFFASPASFRTAFNLAGSLFHFHEWMFEDYRSQLETHFVQPLPNKGMLWALVQNIDHRFGFIRDLANASKHVRLTKNPSTSMTHVANTAIHVGAFSRDFSADFDISRITMKDGSANVLFDFDDCANALFDYWTALLGNMV